MDFDIFLAVVYYVCFAKHPFVSIDYFKGEKFLEQAYRVLFPYIWILANNLYIFLMWYMGRSVSNLFTFFDRKK